MREFFGGEIPKATEEDLKTALGTFPGYVFYKNTEGGGRSFECSRCREKITLKPPFRTETHIERDAMAVSHNDAGLCPICKSEVVFKQDGRTLDGKLISKDGHFTFIYPKSADSVVIVCESISMSFCKGDRTAYQREIDEIFLLRPGDPVFWFYNSYSRKFTELREGDTNDIEPFSHGTMFPVHDPYKIIGLDRLYESFLKYSQFERRSGVICKYLFRFCTHPQYEMLTKMGLTSIVYESYKCGNDMKRHFDWTRTGRDFFKTLTPAEVKEVQKMGWSGVQAMKVRERYKKVCRMTLSEAEAVYHHCDADSHKYLIRYRYDPRKLLRQISRWNEIYDKAYSQASCCHAGYFMRRKPLEDWKDYIRLAIECEYDLAQEVVFFPKDVLVAHDEVTELYNRVMAEKEAAKFEKKNEEALKRLSKRQKKYEWQDGDYFIKVPESLSEIVREGQRQQHCVAGYATRHAEGALTILFMRRVSDPDTSFITIEMSAKDIIVQARRFKNKSPDSDALAFLERYKKHLIERKKKRGNKNSTGDTQRGGCASA